MPFNSEKTVHDFAEQSVENRIRGDAIAAITTSSAKLSPAALSKILSEKYRLPKKQIMAILGELITEGELAYTYQYGSSYLELSYNRPRKVSRLVVLHPPGRCVWLGPDEVTVQIQPGASFGDGRHPTTRLAIRGIETVLRYGCCGDYFTCAKVLDIGCGTGVLVIAAVCLGAASGVGLDLDACARTEAGQNVRLNALEHRIEISGRPLELIRSRFQMVTANLRYPSLIRLRHQLNLLICPDGVLVISGIRDFELDELLQIYAEQQWICCWRQFEAGWAGAVLQRRQYRRQQR
jgi:ribosomal protein L11 methyltransferase